MVMAGLERQVIIKAYPTVIENVKEEREDTISRKLFEKHLSMSFSK
jgi:hypothetical protein